jgi:RNA polymerase sigma-70 factor, ECF subfamily
LSTNIPDAHTGGALPAKQFQDAYQQLKSIAGRLVGRHGAQQQLSIQATALVHELWLNLSRQPDAQPVEDSRRFLIEAATSMRRILIDHYRSRNAQKRGGDWKRVPLRESGLFQRNGQAVAPANEELELLEVALDELRQTSERQAQGVELRFFVGLSRLLTCWGFRSRRRSGTGRSRGLGCFGR